MAQIKMDVSEYEEMKKNKAILEEALANEKKLQEEIKKLNEEKLKAYEAASKKVVRIKRIRTTETILKKRSDYINSCFNRIVENILATVLTRTNRISSHDFYGDSPSRNFLDFFRKTLISAEPSNTFQINLDKLIEDSFETVTTSHESLEDEVQVKGLDEVKAEIRADLESKMDKATKSKLERADEALTKHDSLVKELAKTQKELAKVEKHRQIELEEKDEYVVKYINLLSHVKKEMEDLHIDLANRGSFFGKASLLNNTYDKVANILKSLHNY